MADTEDDTQAFVESRLDMEYVQTSARAVAQALKKNEAIEVNYQPGDGTCYRLVFTPISDLEAAPARGDHWGARCMFGVARTRGAAVVSWIGRGAEGLDLAMGGFHGGYVANLFRETDGSGWTIAILLNAISEAIAG